MTSYLSVRSKFPIQSYTQRVNQPTEKMRVPSCHQESKRVEEKLTLIQSCKQREGRYDPSWKALEASSTSLIPSLGLSISLKNSWGGN